MGFPFDQVFDYDISILELTLYTLLLVRILEFIILNAILVGIILSNLIRKLAKLIFQYSWIQCG